MKPKTRGRLDNDWIGHPRFEASSLPWTSLALTENEAKYFEAIFSFFTIKYFANML